MYMMILQKVIFRVRLHVRTLVITLGVVTSLLFVSFILGISCALRLIYVCPA